MVFIKNKISESSTLIHILFFHLVLPYWRCDISSGKNEDIMKLNGLRIQLVKSFNAYDKNWMRTVFSYLGNEVRDNIASPGSSSCSTSSRRWRMFASTMLKCASKPPYGFPGVPSIMYAPYSGRHKDLTPLKVELLIKEKLSTSLHSRWRWTTDIIRLNFLWTLVPKNILNLNFKCTVFWILTCS